MPEPEEESNLNETLSRVIAVLLRRRWWILLPACSVSLATIAVLWKLPNRYTSRATLLVVQQQVPQRYVIPNSTMDLTSALEAMKQEVLSRTRLAKMIDEFGLYPKERKRLAPEQLVSLMLEHIDITPLSTRPAQRDFDAFEISFSTEIPILAQQVTSTLTSLFINENLRTREEQARNTTQFLREQVEAKRKELEEHEQRLRDFKLRHVGELPEQQHGNLGILGGLQTRLQGTMSALNRVQQQRVYLESLISGYRRQAAAGVVLPVPRGPNVNRALSPLESARHELTRLESTKIALLGKWTKNHPDVLSVQREIDQTHELIKGLETAATLPGREDDPSTSEGVTTRTASSDAVDDPTIAQLKSQLEANRLEIQNLSDDEKQLKAMIAQYEDRLNQAPIREQQQAAILRNTEALRLEYGDLLKKEQESQLATSLEEQQGGQQFRLIDAASLPQVPSSPNRLKISLGGIAAGLFLGAALAFFIDMRDTSFRSEKELAAHLSPPFVLGIPLLPTPSERRRSNWKCAFEWAAGSTLLLVVLVAEFFVYMDASGGAR